MAYTIYAFRENNIWNLRPDDFQTPSSLPLDPSSNEKQLIALSDGFRVVGNGSFTYSGQKTTLADVTSGTLDEVLTYQGSFMFQREVFNPSADFRTVVFGTYQERSKLYTGDDVFYGSADQNVDDGVRGYTGNDRFTGYGSGQYGDYFDGESGFDIAYLRGFSFDYTVEYGSIWDRIRDNGSKKNGFIVTDTRTERDGVDYYVNVERLHFADKVVALDIDGHAGQAYRLYKAALDRAPDERGLAGWIHYMDQGGQLFTMANMFIDSLEFRFNYGSLDNRGFVEQLYLNVLERNGEERGVSGWVNALSQGMSRAQVLVGFSESTENQTNVIGQIQNGIPYTEFWLV